MEISHLETKCSNKELLHVQIIYVYSRTASTQRQTKFLWKLVGISVRMNHVKLKKLLLIQVRLQREEQCTPSSTQPGFELIKVNLQIMTAHFTEMLALTTQLSVTVKIKKITQLSIS